MPRLLLDTPSDRAALPALLFVFLQGGTSIEDMAEKSSQNAEHFIE